MPVRNYDNDLVGRYIRAIENPDSVGFVNGRWYAPTLAKQWNDLSLKEMSDVMAVAVRHGMTSLKNIRDKWNEFAEGGAIPDTVGEYADAIYQNAKEEPYGDPSPHYNNVNEDLLKTLTPDSRGHYDDAVKLPNHPSSPSRGTFNGRYFDLTDEGMQNPNYTLFGLIDNGDADTTLRYKGDYVLPEVTVTPEGNYYDDTYNNIKIMPWDTRRLFKGGGYMPSKAVRDRIANWEGDSMKTNRSFEAEAKDFNRVIPQAVRDSLSQEQLDALYSYGYNVGMGNLKKRVLPTLTSYAQGKVGAEDVASSMWASRDKDLRGLQRRRAYERNQFVYGSPSDRRQSVVDATLSMDLSSLPSGSNLPLVLPPNPTNYGTPVDYSSLIRTTEEPEDEVFKDDGGLGLLSLMRNLGVFGEQQQPLADYKPQQRSPFVVSAPTYNDTLWDDSWFAKGGLLYDEGGYKGATIFRTPSGRLATESGHPIEEIGWDNNGYKRYRDTVTGDLGHAFEPSEAYTKTLVDVSRLPKKEKELETTYPEFDLIGFGGISKGLAELIKNYTRKKTLQKSGHKVFTSELDWSPDSWFGTRVNGAYDADDVAALQSHVPEYLTIEQKAKADGTWLKMPDGSTWKGDPRSWVQLQSKEGQQLMQKPFYHGDTYRFTDMDGNDVTPERLGEGVLWSSSNKYLPLTYGNHHYTLSIPKDTKIVGIDAQGRNYNNLESLGLGYKKTDDVTWDLLSDDNVVGIKNVIDVGHDPRWKAGKNGLPQSLPNEEIKDYFKRVFTGGDYVLGEWTPRKSLLGNNGNFDLANPNIYKGVLPWVLPITAISKYKKQ